MSFNQLMGVRCAVLAGLCAIATGCSKTEDPITSHAPAPAAEATQVQASGKEEVALDAAPADVIAAAQSARPEMEITAVEHETRNGADYYDVAGELNGAEIELDITQIDGRWTVVEVQRDLSVKEVPGAVNAALAEKAPGFAATRIIESDQGEGVVIYEFFGPEENGEETKIEVKFENGAAEVLTSEWLH